MEERVPGSGPSRRRRIAIAVAVLLVLLLAGLWFARLPIATRFVDRELARAGVPARYTFAGLTPGGQRLENVVLGDPANPDLVADWIETETGIGLSGPYLDGVRVGHVRINARLVGGRVSLGSLDRLMPPPSGKPFALPKLRVAGEDVRVRLSTPAGTVGLRLAGVGRLDDGFRGTLAAVAPRLALGGCTVEEPRASVRLAIRDAAPTVAGPVRAAGLDCGAMRARAVGLDVAATLGPALDRWRGSVRLATGAVAAPGTATLGGTVGTVAFVGDTSGTRAAVDLRGADLAVAGATARGISMRGEVAADGGGVRLGDGGRANLSASGVRLAGSLLRRADAIGGAAPSTPVAPLLARIARAVRGAGTEFDATAAGALTVTAEGGRASISTASLDAGSGARAEWAGEAALRWGRDAGAVLDGRLTASGGGLPSVAVQLRRTGAGSFAGVATMAPYAADGARLTLAPVRFVTANGAGTVATVATLSGPLAGGRVEALRLPIAARLVRGGLMLNPDCTPVSATMLRVSGLVLDRPRLTLCPTGPALVRVAGGGVTGGARLPELRLRGRLGSSPLTIDGEGARVDLATRGFAIEGLRTTLGTVGSETRLNFASLDGRIGGGGAVAGRFAGGTGRIGTVPLALGEAAGAWRFAGGGLDVDGALVVTDTADVARFQPMRGEGVKLRLADNMIDANGSLVEPTTGTRVAGVTIAHALGSGVGHADLTVPGITFRQGFQPELLTRVTFGVIADVKGAVSGSGRIDWSPAGVTSTGRFRTDGTDLAAAFGPVAGIAGEIAFDDLLSLRSAPDQRVTVRSINPGIEVTDGVIRFRTLSGTEVEVDSGRWPFAGGTLALRPTLLDFGADRARRMTFVVTGAAADKFLQQFAFDNLQATGTFDGTLPMVFDGTGGRIEGGRLTMREGGGTIAYLGDLTQKDLGFWGNLAFQSLRSLRYRNLDITMNGPLAGEMVTEVKFAGVSQGEGAKSNFLIRRLQRLPFVFNIRIQAPFRGLLDSVQSFYDPKRLIGRNLPALLDAQNKSVDRRVQPPASEKMP